MALLKSTGYGLAALVGLYAIFISLLTIPSVQNQVIYLNHVTQTWFQDLNTPEQWGFLRNQVTPFILPTPDGECLYAWHLLPPGLYAHHEEELLQEPPGLVRDVRERLSFKLLRDDPSSLLVLYFHGAAGTLGSGWRPPSYRAMSVGAPGRIHTVAIDYRGFGSSSGFPSEQGLLTDATTLAGWAMEDAGIPASRIVIFAQSLGTAVALSLVHHMATRPEPTFFSGLIMVAPFADVESLTATYRIAGTIPILDPVARFPRVLAWLNTFILSKWTSNSKIEAFVRLCESMKGEEARYHISIIHAKDDTTIPWSHSEHLFWHAVNASLPAGIGYAELEEEKGLSRIDRGAGGWVVERRTRKGVLREEIMEFGVHDRIMSYPVVSLAVARAFGSLG
ncbi:Uu.00g060190.m01.CDS01 [Anthostomella pinea]|uniref:Uu.00g060190.m01.CDS01 n=1 Tax=Anthostomella pinea TaxID=933095 RepID=A0AAI8VSW5_9PEZI|nr:Uu.00g060190.m01.CDS01 [Anthostomella pinea]